MTDKPQPLSDREISELVSSASGFGPNTVVQRLLATIAALKERVAALTKICTVPGTWHCAKCGFVVQKMILDAHTGAVGVKPDAVTEPCPNGCGPLWPQTERARADALYDDANRFLDERDALQKEVAELKRHGTDVYMAETVNAQDNIIDAQEKRIEALERVLGDALASGLLHGPTVAHQKLLNAVRAALSGAVVPDANHRSTNDEQA